MTSATTRTWLPDRSRGAPLFAGSLSMMLTLAAWGVFWVGIVWYVAYEQDHQRAGKITSDGAIAYARTLAGEGAVQCGVVPQEQWQHVVECAQVVNDRGQRFWFMTYRYGGESLVMHGVVQAPNGRTYQVFYERDSTGGRNDTNLHPHSRLHTDRCVHFQFYRDAGQLTFDCAAARVR